MRIYKGWLYLFIFTMSMGFIPWLTLQYHWLGWVLVGSIVGMVISSIGIIRSKSFDKDDGSE